MSVDESIASIMFLQSMAEIDYYARLNKLVVVQQAMYDKEMVRVANLVSEHACFLVYKKYDFATTTAQYQFCEAHPNVYFIKAASATIDSRDEPNV